MSIGLLFVSALFYFSAVGSGGAIPGAQFNFYVASFVFVAGLLAQLIGFLSNLRSFESMAIAIAGAIAKGTSEPVMHRRVAQSAVLFSMLAVATCFALGLDDDWSQRNAFAFSIASSALSIFWQGFGYLMDAGTVSQFQAMGQAIRREEPPAQ